MNHRTLISTAATCALCATIVGTAAAAPDHIDGGVSELRLFQQRATLPMPVPETVGATSPSEEAGIGTGELSLFHRRAHRFCVERACVAPNAGKDALDRVYELADVRLPAGTTAPAWLDALFARSDALNRMYGLGAYASLSH